MRRISFCAALVVLLVFVLGTTASGVVATAPGGRYDQDKHVADATWHFNDSRLWWDPVNGRWFRDNLWNGIDARYYPDVPAEEHADVPPNNPPWPHQFDMTDDAKWQRECYYDMNRNYNHDPGESHADNINPGWGDAANAAFDRSCWMAAAANIVRNSGGPDYYERWAYTEGVQFGGKEYTFDEGGDEYWALTDAGIAYQRMAGGGYWRDPVEWMIASLKENAVTFGVYDIESAHALTCYAIDTTAHQMTIADSDDDPKGKNFTDYGYVYNDANATWQSAYPIPNILDACALDKIGWLKTDATARTWGVAASWLGSNIPNNNKPVSIVEGSRNQTLDTVTIDGNAVAKSLTMNVQNGQACIVVANNGNLVVSDDIYLGVFDKDDTGQKGWIKQEAGSSVEANNLYLGKIANANGRSNGKYDIVGGELDINNDIYVGYHGEGTFNQSGGNVDVTNYLYLGYDKYDPTDPQVVAGKGTYTMSAAADLDVFDNAYIGYKGKGTFNQTGGTHTVADYLYLGKESGSEGAYNLSGDANVTLTVDDHEYIGYDGKGTFTQTGGTHWVGSGYDDHLYLGYGYADATHYGEGTYTLEGGTLIAWDSVFVGYNGKGTFNQSGGMLHIDDHLYIAYGANSVGTFYLSGGYLAVGDLYINNGWMDIDISDIIFTVSGDRVGLLDGYIADGKIFDNTLCPDGYLYAIYDPDNDWTMLNAVPEPGTIALVGCALVALAGVVRRKM